MDSIQKGIGPIQKGGLVASAALPTATLLARRFLPHAALGLWLTAHSYQVLSGSFAMACLVLVSALLKSRKEGAPVNDRQIIVWQPPPSFAYTSVSSLQNPGRVTPLAADSIEKSLVVVGLPQPERVGGLPLQLGTPIPLPNLIPSVMKSLESQEAAARQINRDLKGCQILIEGTHFEGESPEALIVDLRQRFGLSEELAMKTAKLLTQTCMPEIVRAVGMDAPFRGEDSQVFLLERDTNSRRVVQDSTKPRFEVACTDSQITVVAHTTFYVIENQTSRETLNVTLYMDPLSEQAHYLITLN